MTATTTKTTTTTDDDDDTSSRVEKGKDVEKRRVEQGRRRRRRHNTYYIQVQYSKVKGKSKKQTQGESEADGESATSSPTSKLEKTQVWTKHVFFQVRLVTSQASQRRFELLGFCSSQALWVVPLPFVSSTSFGAITSRTPLATHEPWRREGAPKGTMK